MATSTTLPSSSDLSSSTSMNSTSSSITTTPAPPSSSLPGNTTTAILTQTNNISTFIWVSITPETTPIPTTSTLLTTTATAASNNITSSETSINMTEEEIRQYLSQLHDKEFILFVPAVVFLLIIAVTGLCGNTMVLLVYSTKFHRTATKIFIMTIAASDLLSNVFCIPVEVTDLFYLWNFPNVTLCQMLRYFIASTTITSAWLLLAVAVSRYRKVCRPFGRQVTVRQAQFLSVGIAVFGFFVSIPFCIINGEHKRPTAIPGLNGVSCSTSDYYVHTDWPLINNAFFLLLFLSLCTPLVVLYVLIGIQAYKHSERHGIAAAGKKTRATATSTTSETTDHRTSNRLSRFFKRTTKKYEVVPRKSVSQTKTTDDDSQERQGIVHCETGQGSCVNMELSLTEDKATIHFSKTDEFTLQSNVSTGESASSNEMQTDCDIVSSSESENDKGETKKKGGGITESCGDMKTSPSDINTPGDSGLEKTGAQNGSPDDKDGGDGNGESLSGHASRVQRTDITICGPEDGDQVSQNADTQPISKQSKKLSTSREIFREESQKETLINNMTESGSNDGEEIDIDTSTDKAQTADCTQRNGNEAESKISPASSGMKNSSDGKEHGHSVVKIQDTKTPHRSVINRTTCMLILITVVFIVGYIPYLSLMFFRFFAPETFGAMGPSSLMAHHLFLRFYLVNSAANPIIYSFLDLRFRQEAFRFMRCSK